jgi:hypothetical protein
MRFALDLLFLDREGRVIGVRRRVPPRRIVWWPGAEAVLEIPTCGENPGEGGEIEAPGGSGFPCSPKEKR